MISVTKLWCGSAAYGDRLRYSGAVAGATNGVAAGLGPVVVWNCTRTCNLRCRHCYSSSDARRLEDEMTTAEAYRFIENLAAFKVPVILFSGGEPLTRPDLLELVAYAGRLGIRSTISTNGTLIGPEVARGLKEARVGYVGVSLDGTEEINDHFRGLKGSFRRALEGIRNCLAAGQRVGLRFTINRRNYRDLGAILDLAEEENIPRLCFYHLVYSGRGSRMVAEDISHEETRRAMDLIIERAEDFQRRGVDKEILTVDNHADGVYLYLKLQKRFPERAAEVYELLARNGGNRSGIAIAAVDWQGNVYPDQFTRNHVLGNVRERSFAEIWTDLSNPVLAALKNRKELLQGRCRHCRWLGLCNGNLRVRAEAVTGNLWQADPACYLTDKEIA